MLTGKPARDMLYTNMGGLQLIWPVSEVQAVSRKRNLSMMEYLSRQGEKVQPRLRFAGNSKADFEAWHGHVGRET